MEKEKYYSIGEVSTLCKIPIKTLRYYDEIKVLVPRVRKESSNYRYYSGEQLVTVFIIRQLRMLGFCLKDIHKIIEKNTVEELKKYISIKLRGIEEEIAALQRTYNESKVYLERIEIGEGYLYNHKVGKEEYKIEKIPTIYLYGSRAIMKSYRNEDVNLERWIEINENARKDNQDICGAIYVTYYSEIFGQFFSKDCDVEFSIQVEKKEQHSDKVYKFGGFLAATAVHTGNYNEIIKTYIGLKRWIEEQDYCVTGNVTEEFMISPIDINNQKEQVTRIMIPVGKRNG